MLKRTLATTFSLLAVSALPGCAEDSSAEGPATVEVDGLTIAYEAYGQGEPAVVLVHGAISTRDVWADTLESQPETRRVVSLDLPGHGESDAPSQFTADGFADAVSGVMDAASVERAVLVGHSFGVSVTRDIAVSEPERVAALMMVDGFVVPLGGELGPALAAQFETGAWKSAAANFVEQFMIGAATPDHVADFVRAMMLAGSQEQWLGVLQIATSPDIERDDVVEVPTFATFLGGLTLPPDYEAYLDERFPNLTFEIQPEGTGHFIMLERRDAFLGQLEALLQEAE